MSSPKKSEPARKQKGAEKSAADGGTKKNSFTYVFSVIILGIIIVTFIFTGNSFMGGGQGTQNLSFGSYDGKEIIFAQGNYFYRQFNQNYSQQKSSGDDSQARLGSLKAAFDRTVLQTAFLLEAERQDYQASDMRLSDVLKSFPDFQDENGKFNKGLYKQMKKEQPTELKNIESLVRDDILVQRINGAFETASRMNTKEKDFLTAMGDWERSFKFVSFKFSDYPDTEVSAYIQANAEKFKSRDFSSITLEKKETLDKLRQDIMAGTTVFEAYAKEHSLDKRAAQGGKSTGVFQYSLALDLVEAEKAASLMGLKTGAISEPVAVPAGFAIYRADSDATAADPANPETIKKARSYLSQYESSTIQAYVENLAKNLSNQAQTAGLEAAAAAAGKTVETTASFPINLGGLVLPTMYGDFPVLPRVTTPDFKALSDAQTRKDFFVQAFKLKAGEISAPAVLADQVLVLSLAEEKKGTEPGMFATYAPMLYQYFMNDDINEFFIDKSKLKDQFMESYSTYFM